MLAVVIPIAYAFMGVALLLALWRLMFGPDLPNRILALDTLYVNTAALLVLLGVHQNSTVYFEAALLIALIGFIGTVALCKFVLRGDIIE